MKKLIIVLFCLLTVQMYGQYVHNEKYKTLDVTGEMKSLTIIGEDRTNTVIETKKKDINKANFDVATRKRKLMVEFAESKMEFIIRVPKETNLVIKPYDIVFEGMFDLEKDKRKISIVNMKGSIDIATDGYEVDLVGSNNDISVVSYLDIFADSIRMYEGGSISMDSYLGDVLLRPIPPLDAHITMRAKQGMVELDSIIKIAEKRILIDNNISVIVGDGTSDILLHSEKGAHVLLDMQEELDVQMLKIEEQMIQMDIEMEKMDMDFEKMDEDFEKMEKDFEKMDKDFEKMELMDGFTDSYELFQNEPNPWRKSTKIKYLLDRKSEVEFVFTNVEGEEVFTNKVMGKEGINTLTVTSNMIKETGVIYYTMKFGNAQFTKKMIHMD